jgi:hypothetical protein
MMARRALHFEDDGGGSRGVVACTYASVVALGIRVRRLCQASPGDLSNRHPPLTLQCEAAKPNGLKDAAQPGQSS